MTYCKVFELSYSQAPSLNDQYYVRLKMTDFHTLCFGFANILENFVFCILRARALIIQILKVKMYFH